MMRCDRPVPSAGFLRDQEIETAKQQIEKLSATQSITGEDFKKRDHWGKYKELLASCTWGRCMYCESSVAQTDFGAVDHFRPKSEVKELRPGAIRREEDPFDDTEKSSKTYKKIHTSGYWWLAYEWSNWIFACSRCNTRWKQTLFPGSSAVLARGCEKSEIPQLLDPCSVFRPAMHFRYDVFGSIEGLSVEGKETIRVLGLDRLSLRIQRQPIAELAFARLQVLAEQTATSADALRWFYENGLPWRPYAGMVRTIFEQNCDTVWSRERLAKRFGPVSPPW